MKSPILHTLVRKISIDKTLMSVLSAMNPGVFDWKLPQPGYCFESSVSLLLPYSPVDGQVPATTFAIHLEDLSTLKWHLILNRCDQCSWSHYRHLKQNRFYGLPQVTEAPNMDTS